MSDDLKLPPGAEEWEQRFLCMNDVAAFGAHDARFPSVRQIEMLRAMCYEHLWRDELDAASMVYDPFSVVRSRDEIEAVRSRECFAREQAELWRQESSK